MSSIYFQFVGGMADGHEMNFYEAGRFQYGAARFIYTLERFRQDGTVVRRLASRINADIRIKASRQGSYLEEVILFALPLISNVAVQCSFEAVFAYAWNLILPPSKTKEVAIALAEQEVRREEQRTLQDIERTEQLRIMADVIKTQQATSQQALDILDYACRNQLALSTAEAHLNVEEIAALRDEAAANLSREDTIRSNRSALSQITPQTERKLASQLRKSVADLAFPLRSSAKSLRISQGVSDSPTIAALTAELASSISQEIESELAITILASIKSYDVETGCGKLRYGEHLQPISFRVPTAAKEKLRPLILDGMSRDTVLVCIYEISDSYGSVTKVVLDNILSNETLDDLGIT